MIVGKTNNIDGVNAYIDGEYNNISDFYDFSLNDLF